MVLKLPKKSKEIAPNSPCETARFHSPSSSLWSDLVLAAAVLYRKVIIALINSRVHSEHPNNTLFCRYPVVSGSVFRSTILYNHTLHLLSYISCQQRWKITVKYCEALYLAEQIVSVRVRGSISSKVSKLKAPSEGTLETLNLWRHLTAKYATDHHDSNRFALGVDYKRFATLISYKNIGSSTTWTTKSSRSKCSSP